MSEQGTWGEILQKFDNAEDSGIKTAIQTTIYATSLEYKDVEVASGHIDPRLNPEHYETRAYHMATKVPLPKKPSAKKTPAKKTGAAEGKAKKTAAVKDNAIKREFYTERTIVKEKVPAVGKDGKPLLDKDGTQKTSNKPKMVNGEPVYLEEQKEVKKLYAFSTAFNRQFHFVLRKFTTDVYRCVEQLKKHPEDKVTLYVVETARKFADDSIIPFMYHVAKSANISTRLTKLCGKNCLKIRDYIDNLPGIESLDNEIKNSISTIFSDFLKWLATNLAMRGLEEGGTFGISTVFLLIDEFNPTLERNQQFNATAMDHFRTYAAEVATAIANDPDSEEADAKEEPAFEGEESVVVDTVSATVDDF